LHKNENVRLRLIVFRAPLYLRRRDAKYINGVTEQLKSHFTYDVISVSLL